MEIIERISDICKKNGTTVANLEKELGYSNGSLAKAKNIPSGRILEISKYFHVSMEYLMTGEESLTPKDSRDIRKDLDSIMDKLQSGSEGPASYDGEELSPEAMELFRDELEIALKRLKIMNKEKYTPKKYKKQVK
jgi:transcriptional regulator with XRE-family HTH domain